LENGKYLKNNSFPEKFNLDDIDVIFLDIYLKEENGFNILLYMTKNYPDIYVIIVSGENKRSTVAQAVEYGAKDFLAKPFDNEIVLKKLQKYFDKNNTLRENNNLIKERNIEISSFNTNLNIELNRSLRSGLPVSFLKVEFNHINNNDAILEIKNNITTSIRDIDQIYFLDSKKLCFLLPLTDKEGRKVFRDKIEKIILKEENKKDLENNEEILINDITFPDDIIEEDSSNLDYSKQNFYKKKIMNKLAINTDKYDNRSITYPILFIIKKGSDLFDFIKKKNFYICFAFNFNFYFPGSSFCSRHHN
jgi:DNA-binding response OmpR family regulator